VTRQVTSPDSLPYYQASDTPDGAAQQQDLANVTQSVITTMKTATTNRVKGGVATVTGDANGFVTWNHGFTGTPVSVMANVGWNGGQPTAADKACWICITGWSSTQVSAVLLRYDTGAGFASNPVHISWVAV
jgi:hypothetical protein